MIDPADPIIDPYLSLLSRIADALEANVQVQAESLALHRKAMERDAERLAEVRRRDEEERKLRDQLVAEERARAQVYADAARAQTDMAERLRGNLPPREPWEEDKS